MQIKEFYNGLSDDQIEKYRQEVRERWGEDTLNESEDRIIGMGKEGFAKVQAEGASIFETIGDNIPKGFDSDEVQEQIVKWRKWLDNFSTYSDEAILGLGQAYSQHPRFIKTFRDINEDLPEFLTKAIEYYCSSK
jgi:hypothetical protein